MDVSELLQIDEDHISRLAHRRDILAKPQHEALFCTDQASGAVSELYHWLAQTYLPTRFPTLFRIDDSQSTLRNLANGDEFPLKPRDEKTALLHRLGSMIDEDVMILLPSSDGDGYALGAYVVAYASGFDISGMKGAKLRDIHREVPGYQSKLQMPMERFFGRLEIGRYVKRANVSPPCFLFEGLHWRSADPGCTQWTIVLDDKLCVGRGVNHVYVDEQETLPVGADLSKVRHDITILTGGSYCKLPSLRKRCLTRTLLSHQARLRCERQVLHRLPASNAIVFSYKTYLYSLDAVKSEGSGEALAEAIRGLEGTPGMPRYRGSLRWGEAVRAYLLAPPSTSTTMQAPMTMAAASMVS
jgi:hypothetical protein